MQELQIKERLKSAIQIYKKTKDPRAAKVIEHLNKILSTSKSRDSLIDYAKHIYPGTTKTKINLSINILMEPFLVIYFHFVK